MKKQKKKVTKQARCYEDHLIFAHNVGLWVLFRGTSARYRRGIFFFPSKRPSNSLKISNFLPSEVFVNTKVGVFAQAERSVEYSLNFFSQQEAQDCELRQHKNGQDPRKRYALEVLGFLFLVFFFFLSFLPSSPV